MNERYQRRRRRRLLRLFLELIFAAIFIVAVVMLVKSALHKRIIGSEESAAGEFMQAIVTPPATVTPEAPAKTAAGGDTSPEIFDYFTPLLEQNEDIVGLVGFGDDHVLYVCQGEDNSFYATHRFDKSEDPAGMIYMDVECQIYPKSDNIVLYGHNMSDGSRFGTLQRYLNKEYLLKYPVFRFATLYEVGDYVPYAVMRMSVNPASDDYFPHRIFEFDNAQFAQTYIEEIQARSEYKIPIDVDVTDEFLTLITCTSEEYGQRYMIACRKLRAGETGDSYAAIVGNA